MAGDDDEDARLMEAVARGDRRAFATLFDRHQGSVVRFCFRFVGTQARAEELAQDVFVKLFRGAKGYRPQARFKTYLFRVATNHCLNELRRGGQKVEQTVAREQADDERPTALEQQVAPDSPQLSLEGKQLEAAVAQALERLSERERAAFCMCRFEGLAYKDIGAALEASEAAVKSLVHRATMSVMKQLESWQQGPEAAQRSSA